MPSDNRARFIGCCGAYCKTCKPFLAGFCKGCKIGFDTGARDIRKAKCRIKMCCFADNGLATCADCKTLHSCSIMREFFGKKGYKYGKYRQSLEFIRKNGYEKFFAFTEKWKCAYGKLE